jgi:hypothetical protein
MDPDSKTGTGFENAPKTGKHYSAQISEEGLSVLRSLIGKTVWRVYASCLQVAGPHVAAPAFSIPISSDSSGSWIHRFVVVRCQWFETPLLLTDYWQIIVSDEEAPHDIEIDSTGAIVAPCTVCFYRAAPVARIDLYSFEASFGEGEMLESVAYDRAIRIHTAEGKSLCICCQSDGPGILTEVNLSEDEATISHFLEGSRLRLSITTTHE